MIFKKLKYPDIRDAISIRTSVFVEEQGYSIKDEFDGLDSNAIHYVGYEDDEPVCTIRIFEEDSYYKFGRIAVLEEHRNKGYGLAMVMYMIDKMPGKNFKVSSQIHAVPFYEKIGFVVSGDEYMEDGQPHILMIKK